MLRPHSLMDPSRSVLRAAADILTILLDKGTVSYPRMLTVLNDRLGDAAVCLVLPALSLLFILGKINYDRSSDEVRLAR